MGQAQPKGMYRASFLNGQEISNTVTVHCNDSNMISCLIFFFHSVVSMIEKKVKLKTTPGEGL